MATTTKTKGAAKNRYNELKKMLEDRRRELLSEVQGRMRDVRLEGNKERVQVFQGVVIARQGGGVNETFTVRKVSYGVGVERTFPVHSPIIDRIEVVTRGDVRRAKLYYIRGRRGKSARIAERRDPKREAAKAETTDA